MSGYNSKARPVKNEDTVTKVSVFLNIAHIEKINEREQTMLVHGHLWASWYDEYLTWRPEDYNGTSKVLIPAWKIWQPAFALYNSAKGNAWHLYMNGLPATVYSTGKVWASGTYSFYVTCYFDFSNWPFDVQECPIVIADWVYDLSRVNLSDPEGLSEYLKPTIRLSYDPVAKKEKKHLGGWEVLKTWKKHCYWGPNGCKEDVPEGKPEWYWSLLEFGVVIQRHVPYFGATMLIPAGLTVLLILISFWINTFSVMISVLVFNIMLQGLYGWEMIEKMPPGSGSTPKIVKFYSMNLSLCAVAFVYAVIAKFIEDEMPENYKINFGIDITQLLAKFGLGKVFTPTGISFDPQDLMNGIASKEEEIESGGTSNTLIGMSDALIESGEVEMGSSQPSASQSGSEMLIAINLPTNSSTSEEHPQFQQKTPSKSASIKPIQLQLHTIRRILFLVYVVIYVIVVAVFLIF
ncbi:unnamed protein product [Caenorhabditis bovis]|uniref:Acetylcholine receptor-like protein cup-4 n=1 Tax=Caenorhabditis bovis TaxID=2654633 RepID=A0A8S1EE99_9PELO|nr:unnamed protein product [Caenorhabditis bovis]